MTSPVTEVEKHHLDKVRQQNKDKTNPGPSDINTKQLLDIIKLKIKYERKMNFLDFLGN